MAWTLDDFNSGKIAYDPGKGWSPDEWVDWQNKYHPQEDSVSPPGSPVTASLGTAATPSAASGSGGAGNDALGSALAGLKSAQTPTDDSPQGYSETSSPGASDPGLGTRLMPILMQQLSQQGRRIY